MKLAGKRVAQWGIGGVIGACVAGAIVVAVAHAAPSAWTTAGQVVSAAQAGSEKVVATVSHQNITQADVQTFEALAQLNNAMSTQKVSTSAAAAQHQAIVEDVLYAEAVREGLAPTAADTAAYVAQVHAAIDANRDAHAELAQYLSGMHTTEAAFFANPSTKSAYARALATARLRSRVLAGIPESRQISAWTMYVNKLLAAAKVTNLRGGFSK